MDEDEELTEENLSIPLIVCSSHGGEYDDNTFSAGIQLGQIDAILTIACPHRYSTFVFTGICPQLDLIAMHHGYLFKAEPVEGQEEYWVRATFALAP